MRIFAGDRSLQYAVQCHRMAIECQLLTCLKIATKCFLSCCTLYVKSDALVYRDLTFALNSSFLSPVVWRLPVQKARVLTCINLLIFSVAILKGIKSP